MSYGNYNNRYQGGYNQGGYNRGGNNRGGYNQGGNDYRQPKKHSGARMVRSGDHEFLSAWKYSKGEGMLSITGNFWKLAKSANYDWEVWVISIVNRKTGQKTTHSALRNPKTGKFRIKQLNWVINPSAPNGGYCGQAFSKEFKAGRR